MEESKYYTDGSDQCIWVLRIVDGMVFYIKYSYRHSVYNLGCDSVKTFDDLTYYEIFDTWMSGVSADQLNQ